LTSLDDILNSGIEIGYRDVLSIFFSVSSDLRHNKVVERAEICSTEEMCFERMQEKGNLAVFSSMWVIEYYKNNISDHTICLLNDDDCKFIFVTTYVQKGSFLLESLNKYITNLIESGMLARMARDTLFAPKPISANIDVTAGYFVFTLSHLRIAFYVLFVGQGVSFLVFLCELFYHFIHRYV
jgi:hypothetical protein